MSALFTKMVIFAVMIAIGYIGARRGNLGENFVKGTSELLLKVFIVASIVNSVLGERPDLGNGGLGNALLCLLVSFIIIYAIGFVFCFIFYRKNPAAPQIELLISVVNNLFIGIPVLSAVIGGEGVFYMGMSAIIYNPILYTYGIWRLKQGRSSKKFSLKDMITLPLIGALIAGAIFLLDLQVPKVITELVGTVANATIPVSMIVIGATLGKIKLRDAFTDKISYAVSLAALIITPIVVWFALAPFTDNPALRLSCTVMAGCPSGIIVTPLSIQYGYNPEVSSKVVMVSTVLSMFTLPILIKLFG